MSTHQASPLRFSPTRRVPGAASWLHATPLWAGLSIVSMWLAVLFVGIFGGDIVTSTPAGSSSSVPVVVVVALVALITSWVLGRTAFGTTADSEDLHRALADEREARERLAADVEDLRSALSGGDR